MKVKTAIVVGGGIGGLTAALALARKGVKVSLLESVANFGEVGAGIQVSPNATRVLHAFGLEEPIGDRAFHTEAAEMRTWRRGRTVARIEIGTEAINAYGAPYLHLHRADLLAVLAEAVASTGQVTMHFDVACSSVNHDDEGAIAFAEDGRKFRADVIVGADGIKSAVRESIFGPSEPRFTGCVAWRGLVPAEDVRDIGLGPVVANWMGPGRHFVHYYVRGGGLVNCVAVIEKTGWELESWTARGEKGELFEAFAGWHPTVQTLIGAMDPEECFKWALFDRDPLDHWSRGPVTLLGDACHPTLPFMAQGACMAIEDAAVLAECLDSPDEIEVSLARYELLRKARTSAIQRGSRDNKTLYHLAGPKAVLRNLGMLTLSGRLARRVDELYAYDAFEAAKAG